MGIRGLTTYVEKRASDLSIEIKLKNTKVIIDGNSLYHHLYFSSQLDCRSGGQYNRFHDIVTSFFDFLRSNEIQAFVVLDGASDASDRKLNTSIKRTEESISRAYKLANSAAYAEPIPAGRVRPTLLRRTFLQTLSELEVAFAVCDCEADEEIASLANKWECPVISEDSDFFIFDLKAGYIPLKHINLGPNTFEAKLFKIEKLSAHLEISTELLPLLASLLGNDFINDDIRMPLYDDLGIFRPLYTDKIISNITSLLRSRPRKGLQSILTLVPDQNRREALRQALKMSIDSYKDCDTELATYFETGDVLSKLKSRSNAPVEPWVLRNVRQGVFPVMCMEVLTVGRLFFKPQVEDFDATSADQCSLELRRFIYGFLGKDHVAAVEENHRMGTELQQSTVEPHHHQQKLGELPNLRTIPDLKVAERHKFYLSLLESNTDLVLGLPDELQVFAASLRYWYKHANPPIKESHLRALIVCSLKLTEEAEQLPNIQALTTMSFSLDAQHNFAQWQCVMRDAVNLNLILQEPLPTPRIHNLYDGLLVQELVSDFETGSNTHMSWQSKDVFQRLYNAVMHKRTSRSCTPGPCCRIL